MLQIVLTGKAGDVFLSLTSEHQKDYQTVKVPTTLLRNGPRQYRKSFRELRRQQGQTYVEFVREKERYLNRLNQRMYAPTLTN